MSYGRVGSLVGLLVLVAMLAVPLRARAQGAESTSGDAPAVQLNDEDALSSYYAVDSFRVNDAVDIEVDPHTGHLWITKANKSGVLRVFRPNGRSVDKIGGRGDAPGQMGDNPSLHIDDTSVFVADWSNSRISVFDTDGNFKRVFGNEGDRPCSVHSFEGRVYVRSHNSNKLRVFNARSGALVNEIDGSASGRAYTPTDCHGNDIAVAEGEIYISDHDGDRIMVFDDRLNWVRDITVERPGALDIASSIIWVGSQTDVGIRQLTLDGTEVGRLQLEDGSRRFTERPALGIEVDPSGSTFWLADLAEEKIWVFTNLRCGGDKITIMGTEAGETINGTPDADVIHLGAGDDTSTAGSGNDVVCGGDGDDALFGFDGNDTLFGGADNDRLTGNKGDDKIDGGTGNDSIHGNRGNDVLLGGFGNDRIYGYSEDDLIKGGPGNDRLHGNFGADQIFGGKGDDFILGYAGDDALSGDLDNDFIAGNMGEDTISGGPGNDMLLGDEGADAIWGGDGDDTLSGSVGLDVLSGDEGDDRLDGGDNRDTCDGGPGANELVSCEKEVSAGR